MTQMATRPGDLARLLSAVLEQLQAEDNSKVYTLEEVAAETRFSLRQIEKDCRAERVRHVHQGQLRGMTRAQITELVERYTVAPSPESKTEAEKAADARARAANFNAARSGRTGRRAA